MEIGLIDRLIPIGMIPKFIVRICLTFDALSRHTFSRRAEMSKSLAVVTSIAAAMAVTLLVGVLQLNPSAWKTISVVSSIVSTMLFLASALLHGLFLLSQETSPEDVANQALKERLKMIKFIPASTSNKEAEAVTPEFLRVLQEVVKIRAGMDSEEKMDIIMVAATLTVFCTIMGYFALVIALGCFVGSENWWYAVIALFTGMSPWAIFLYLYSSTFDV